jgi:epoxyqueuosine reductase
VSILEEYIMSSRKVTKGINKYIVGVIDRFDEKNVMIKRPIWDESLMPLGKKFYGVQQPKSEPGYTLLDQAFKNAAYYLDLGFAKGMFSGREGLYAWESKPWGENIQPKGLKFNVDDPAEMTKTIKKAARFFGASLVSICEFDRRWLYSRAFNAPISGRETYEEIDISEEIKYTIVLAYEESYEIIKYSPSYPSGAEIGLGYSKMAFTTGLLSQFIRLLGYKAIPCGNDTATTIPLAIEAGLGELGRNGILITEKYGPRVRLNKIFTNLSLIPDEPIEFGVWEFCKKCKKCAIYCPSQAILYDTEPTTEVHDISNRTGLLRWPINAEKCFRFWAANGTACANCIRVCPFNKPIGRIHDGVRWMVHQMPFTNPILIWMDDFFGYGREENPKKFWE